MRWSRLLILFLVLFTLLLLRVSGVVIWQTPTSEPGGAEPKAATPERFMSDEEFLKIGEEFDLDAFIKSLNPPTVEEIIKSLEPIPTREQILEDLQHPERRPKPPTLPEDVAKQIEELDKQTGELERAGATGDDLDAQKAALDEAIRVAERVVQLRIEAGQPEGWHEVCEARNRVKTLKPLGTLSLSDRRQFAAAKAHSSELEEAYVKGRHEQGLIIVRSQLIISQRLFPGDHPDVATALNDLAMFLQDRGALQEAELLYRESLPMLRRLFPDDDPHVGGVLLNFATLLQNRGALQEGERLVCKSLAMTRRVFSGDHAYVAQGLNDLAGLLEDRGALEEAEPLFRDALAMWRRLFPGDHPMVALGLNNLANLLHARGALQEAEQLFRESLAMSQRLFPGDQPDVAVGLDNLANLLYARGALQEAEQLSRESLAMRRRLFPGDHRGVAVALNILAMGLRGRGALEEAEQLSRDSLGMFQRLFPGDHPWVALGLNNLALLLKDSGALQEADPLLRESLAMRRRLFPGDHPHVAEGLGNLATLLQTRGALEEAEALHRESLAMTRRLFPGDHRDAATGLGNLASHLQTRGELEEAEPLCLESLGMWRRLFPGDHPDVAISLNNLALLLEARGALTEAEPLYAESFEMRQRLRTQIIGGEQERAAFAEELDLSGVRQRWATVLTQAGRNGEAFSVLERGRARAALDLLKRSERDLTAEAMARGDSERAQRLQEAQEQEKQALIDLRSTEALVVGRRRERDALEKRSDIEAESKAGRLAAYDKEISALVDEVKSKQQALTQAGAAVLVGLQGLFPAGRALSTEEILQRLAPDEAVISVAWTEGSILVAFAASGRTGAEIVAKDKETVRQVKELVAQVHGWIAERSGQEKQLDPAATRNLVATLFPESIQSGIAGARRMIVLPDGPLNDIPLEFLAEVEPTSVLAGKSIVYAPSATVYLDRVQRAQALDRTKSPVVALALGDPVFDRGRAEPTYPDKGVLITAAVEGGNADKAGLKRGDVLLRYDGNALEERSSLSQAVGAVSEALQKGERPADQKVKIAYWRDGREAEVELPPGKLGVQIQGGSPAEGLRSMAFASRGLDAAMAEASALDQVRLFGGSLRRLPGTRLEAQAIAGVFERVSKRPSGANDAEGSSESPVRLLLGVQATLGNLTKQAGGVRYLHLATHGLMGNAERPYEAALALTQPQEWTAEDIGFLRLQDLMSSWGGRLKDCELVVLSGCDTQRGVPRGDTMMSLPLGFFFAGAPTVVASLWRVDDASTAILMEDFYRNMLEHKMPIVEALRQAKLTLKNMTLAEAERRIKALGGEDAAPIDRSRAGEPRVVKPMDKPFEHPYYWAPFIVIGAG